jgi:hypothetical protein
MGNLKKFRKKRGALRPLPYYTLKRNSGSHRLFESEEDVLKNLPPMGEILQPLPSVSLEQSLLREQVQSPILLLGEIASQVQLSSSDSRLLQSTSYRQPRANLRYDIRPFGWLGLVDEQRESPILELLIGPNQLLVLDAGFFTSNVVILFHGSLLRVRPPGQ